MLRPAVQWIVAVLLILLGRGCAIKFTLLHTNDMHSWFDPQSEIGGKCLAGDDEEGHCFGGFGRVATAVSEARKGGTVIYLNGGDTFQGTPWYTVYKGKMVAQLMNMLAPDAMALGNHEFDDGVEGLVSFLELVKFPVVACNLDLQRVPKLQASKQLVRSTIITKQFTKIGVVGYIRPDTKDRVQPNDVVFGDEIPAINAETTKLLDQGATIIIALGHAGFERDKEIARDCPDVDIVVGGQSHTFLYTGKPPGKELPEEPYPTIVFKPDGIKVLVLQAYAFTKYLGWIDLEFDNGGNMLSFRGNPMLLDNSVHPRRDVQELLDRKRKVIDDMERHVVGTTMVYLNGDRASCSLGECNFGNFIADSLVYARVLEQTGPRKSWTDAAIGLINSGGIRASINPGPTGAITEADVMTVLPFDSDLYYTRISGNHLMKALEHSADQRDTESGAGYLQVSGLHLKFNYNRTKGQRISSIRARCTNCQIPFYEAVDREKYYGVIVSSFLLSGGDGHNFVDPDRPEFAKLLMNDREALIRYLQEHKIVYPEREERIISLERKASCSSRILARLSLLSILLYAHV
ncbi:LOW QUALITY PROTEIN: protein 5NUC [Drosophila obscura]|uniref:LOW QUALITY PROTEIN: protein 5NUC n=1 Tax=Drosophila obscura TaxID=7282 RepID=UPI001BB208A6|nr:LOW QUALITY PROTEIN: protein 5NUC [Drosophila obscura]